MAKELPYFKFEPAEWQNGSIQMCSPESKMLFIDICCNYWQRLGDVPYAFALHAVCKGNENALQELKQAGVIDVKDDKISIVFLDEQLEERISISDKARESARRRWDSKKNDANALQTQSKGNAKRKEKKREEEIREENKRELFNNWISYKKEIKKPLKSERSITALINKFNENSYDCCKWVVNNSIENQYQGLFWQNYKPKQSSNENLPNGRRIAI